MKNGDFINTVPFRSKQTLWNLAVQSDGTYFRMYTVLTVKDTVFAKNRSLTNVMNLNIILFAKTLNALKGQRKLSFFFLNFHSCLNI